MEYITNLYLV